MNGLFRTLALIVAASSCLSALAQDPVPAAKSATTEHVADPTIPQGTLRLKAARPTVAEIREACPGASSDFIVAQLETGATIEAIRSAWSKLQEERLAELLTANIALLEERQTATQREQRLLMQLSEQAVEIKDSKSKQSELINDFKKLLEAQASLMKENAELKVHVATLTRALPEIRVQSRIINAAGEGVVMLNVEGQMFRLKVGNAVRVLAGTTLTTVHIEDITEESVELRLTPQNQTLSLR